MASKEFTGKVVIITGAGSGIGASAAINFAKLGASLVLIGRNIQNLKNVQRQCSSSPKAHIITADLTNPEDIQRIVDETIYIYGKINVLVNNAGIFELGSFEEASLEQLDRIFNTNIRSVFQLTKLVLPYLKITKGNIINNSSLAGCRSVAGLISYSMSKACLDHFTTCLAMEQASNGVRVNAVNPGVIATELYAKTGIDEKNVAMFMEAQKSLHPLGRIGQPEEVAEAIVYLSSDRASFVTGVLLSVDGGRREACNNVLYK